MVMAVNNSHDWPTVLVTRLKLIISDLLFMVGSSTYLEQVKSSSKWDLRSKFEETDES